MKMCVDNKQRFHYIKVKIIGESIRLLEQPSRICDSLCKNRILDFQVLRDPISCSTISNARGAPFGTNDQSKKLAFLAKEQRRILFLHTILKVRKFNFGKFTFRPFKFF